MRMKFYKKLGVIMEKLLSFSEALTSEVILFIL